MKMVIEIDKKAFDYIMACSFVEDEAVMLNQSLEDRIKTLMFFDVLNAIKSGTPLPKGHGRLIDADELKKAYDERITDLYTLSKKDNPSREAKICATNWCANTIDELPTIIESESEE